MSGSSAMRCLSPHKSPRVLFSIMTPQILLIYSPISTQQRPGSGKSNGEENDHGQVPSNHHPIISQLSPNHLPIISQLSPNHLPIISQ
ncbi:hypothetical protein PoB_004989200 [Plakobranchus ocellatus]|uniref:Uncharacterized protein n=1 Tax=Plakobranchus ocellatus TaxID=259542 RepID=A0AAV4BWF3_9GAST|nr:hypothetical protein PoB_004989200 [Plakobranchus ocellatus]